MVVVCSVRRIADRRREVYLPRGLPEPDFASPLPCDGGADLPDEGGAERSGDRAIGGLLAGAAGGRSTRRAAGGGEPDEPVFPGLSNERVVGGGLLTGGFGST